VAGMHKLRYHEAHRARFQRTATDRLAAFPAATYTMTGPQVAALLNMLATGRDDALLRYSLGNTFFKNHDAANAVTHLREAVRHDPQYSAAWKLLGHALEATGDAGAATDAWRTGITVAETRGDQQAAKEMAVFLKRLEKRGAGDA
jgi:Tfp pilus assembly protein PilF